ncbi:JAB domain-containing protein [Otoolea muris]|uniref:JAB domain-containing protein n=1 Tax=Otoolea muris TaxID=2941515 RepID=UPI001364BEFE|nr:JAB domain-containing protein [Otoolea muris]
MRITKYGLITDQQRYFLIKESAVNYAVETLTTGSSLYKMLNDLYRLNQLAEEHIYLVGFTNRGRPLGVFEVSHGTGNVSLIQPREVFMRLLLVGASSFAIAHNHPSGDFTPSGEDINVTKCLKEAGDMMKIPMLDHIIAGSPGYYSFYANGFFAR